MSRINIPDIPKDIVNHLTTIGSTLSWIEKLEKSQKRLEEELSEIKMVLKYVVYPKFTKLNMEIVEHRKNMEIDSLRNIIREK